MRLSTLQTRWLHLPGVLTRTSNRKVLHMPRAALASFRKLEKAA